MPKPHRIQRRNKYLQQGLAQLNSRSSIEAVERLEANQNEGAKQYESENGIGFVAHLDPSHLEGHTGQPNTEKDKCEAVDLVVDQLVVVVQLKDENIVHSEHPEKVYGKAHCSHDKHQYKCELESLYGAIDLVPVLISCVFWLDYHEITQEKH
jgi:hypothetical protein